VSLDPYPSYSTDELTLRPINDISNPISELIKNVYFGWRKVYANAEIKDPITPPNESIIQENPYNSYDPYSGSLLD
jgi:hypothetical protein